MASSLVVWGVLAHAHLVPALFPDEVLYAKISQGIADGNGATLRGEGQGLPPLYPYAISIGWLFGSTPTGYVLVKLLGVLFASLTAVPVWLLGRELVGPRRALIPATLMLAGAWMTFTGQVVSENLALPLAAAALASTVAALRRPGSLWIWVALGFAAAGAGTRVILFGLPVVILLALAIDVAVRPATQRRKRLLTHGPPLVLLVGAGLLGLIWIAATGADGIGRYRWPRLDDLGVIVTRTGQHGLLLIAMLAVLPLALAVALALRPRNWRDPEAGPLLATLVPTVLVFTVVAGWFTASVTPWAVERYVVYAVPLALVALVVAPGRVSRLAVFGTGAGLALALALLPEVPRTGYPEQPAASGLFIRAHDITGASGHLVIVVVALVVIGVGGWLSTTSGIAPGKALSAIAVLLAVVMVVQVQAAERYAINFSEEVRHLNFPARMDWIDRATQGDVSMVAVGKPQAIIGVDLITEVFNRHVTAVFRDPDDNNASIGRICRWRVVPATGAFGTNGVGCPPLARRVVLERGPFVTRFREERQLADGRLAGRLVELPANPRVLALIREPCRHQQCLGQLTTVTWLERPATMVVRFSGGANAARVAVGRRVYDIAPFRFKDVPVRVRAGTVTSNLELDWQTTEGAPRLLSIVIRQGRASTRIY